MTCKAFLDGPFCHKPHDMGDGCYKHKVATGQLTSVGKNLLRMGKERGSAGRHLNMSDSKLKKARYTPLRAKYIGQVDWNMHPTRQQDLSSSTPTQEDLSMRRTAMSTSDIYRERRDTGRRADRPLSLVGKGNPRVETELRFFVAKHPWKVAGLLSTAIKAFPEDRGEQRKGSSRWGDKTKGKRRRGRSKS